MLYIYYTFYPYDKCDQQKNFQTMSIYRKKLLDSVFTEHTGNTFDINKIAKGKNGKPYLKNSPLHFNLSHTNGLICCGISNMEIGIDCERIRNFNVSLLDKVCTQSEKYNIISADNINRAFFTYWTLKESYCKFTGNGLSENLKNIEFTIQNVKPLSQNRNVHFLFSDMNEFVISACSADKYLYCRHKYCPLKFV